MALGSELLIRVPEDWRRWVKSEAALRGITVSWLVRAAVSEYLANHPREEANKYGEEER